MRRFRWPLQRLLNVTAQRELGLRSRLMALLQQITTMRQEIIRRTAALRALLDDIARQDIADRIGTQGLFLDSAEWSEKVIADLRAKAGELASERAARTSELMKLRKKHERLESMRVEARRRHVRGQVRQEQKQFDESSQIAFSRALADPRAVGQTGA